MAASNPSPFHELTTGNFGLPMSNTQDMSCIAYGELTGAASDGIDGAVVVVIGGEKDLTDRAFGYMKVALE